MTSTRNSPAKIIREFYKPSTDSCVPKIDPFGNVVSEWVDFRCPICSSSDLDANGTVVCRKCASSIGPEIQSGADTQYGDGDDVSRCNTLHNPLLEESNYTTGIAGDSYMQRLNKWSHIPYVEKLFAHEFRLIESTIRRARLDSNIGHTAMLLYREAVMTSRSGIADLSGASAGSRKRRCVGLFEACIYHACINHGLTLSQRDVAQMCDSTESNVIRGCKAYFKLIGSDACRLGDSGTKDSEFTESTESESTVIAYAIRFCDSAGLDDHQKSLVVALVERVIQLNLVNDEIHFNENPNCVASACLYFSSVIYNFQLNKSTVALQSGVSEVTLAKIYKKLLKVLNKIV